MYKKLVIFLLLILIVALPFIFKNEVFQNSSSKDADNLVILTAHNEALRYEFTRGFKQWYFKKHGRPINIDWRIAGAGSNDAVKYVDTLYLNAFKRYWEHDLGKEWNFSVQDALAKRTHPNSKNILQRTVHDAFDNADITCGMDLFFGGGKVDIVLQALKGQIVPSGIFERYPEWFEEGGVIPYSFAGNNFWDEDHRWVGTAISGFGIIYNKDALAEYGLPPQIDSWEGLADPKLIGSVAMTDPAVSATFTMALEIILQKKMQEALAQNSDMSQALSEGWNAGMELIQLISANSKYFTDAATKPVLDVSAGDCAAGIAIDFFGLFQEENLRNRSGSDRFGFVIPQGGSAVSPDPIALFKGAPNPEIALDFIEYVLSVEGQKLWDYKVGAPGGPEQYALSRPPIRKDLYTQEHQQYRNNPQINLYKDAEGFQYHEEWTGDLFKEIRFITKVAFIDAHQELAQAWEAIIQARKEGRMTQADRAQSHMQQLELISRNAVLGPIKSVLRSGDSLREVQMEAKFNKHFRTQYREAQALAQEIHHSSANHHP